MSENSYPRIIDRKAAREIRNLLDEIREQCADNPGTKTSMMSIERCDGIQDGMAQHGSLTLGQLRWLKTAACHRDLTIPSPLSDIEPNTVEYADRRAVKGQNDKIASDRAVRDDIGFLVTSVKKMRRQLEELMDRLSDEED